MKKAVIAMFALATLVFQPVLNALAESNILGQVAGTGKAEVLIGENNWSLIDSAYPVVTDYRYRTGDGRLSFILNDGTRIETAEGSEIVLRGTAGNYTLEFVSGEVAFNVPEGSSLQIMSSNHLIDVSGGNAVGSISYEGDNIRVVSISGEQSIRTLSGERIMDLVAGSAVISPEGEIVPIALEGAGTASGTAAGTTGGISKLILPSILVIGGAGVAFGLGGGDDEKTASPSTP